MIHSKKNSLIMQELYSGPFDCFLLLSYSKASRQPEEWQFLWCLICDRIIVVNWFKLPKGTFRDFPLSWWSPGVAREVSGRWPWSRSSQTPILSCHGRITHVPPRLTWVEVQALPAPHDTCKVTRAPWWWGPLHPSQWTGYMEARFRMAGCRG